VKAGGASTCVGVLRPLSCEPPLMRFLTGVREGGACVRAVVECAERVLDCGPGVFAPEIDEDDELVVDNAGLRPCADLAESGGC
jgi:hypothetical protein